MTSQGMPIGAKNFSQSRIIQAACKNDVIFAIGPAGTGKTFIAVALALEALENDKHIDKIIITRPAVEAGEHLGFLPGDMNEKIGPYMQPLYDALFAMRGRKRIETLLEIGDIEIVPLAYMRGRTLNRAFVVADEMQNASYSQLKMLLSRMGLKSRMVITGDASQTDLPYAAHPSLRTAHRILQSIPGVKFIEMSIEDVVRHALVAQMLEAYTDFEEEIEAERPIIAPSPSNGVNSNGVH